MYVRSTKYCLWILFGVESLTLKKGYKYVQAYGVCGPRNGQRPEKKETNTNANAQPDVSGHWDEIFSLRPRLEPAEPARLAKDRTLLLSCAHPE